MDVSSAIGLVVAWGAIIVAFIMEGGHLRGLLNPSAALIVIGGTLGATVLSVPLRRTLAIPVLVTRVFLPPRRDAAELIETLVRLSGKARREGVLSLEADLESLDDDFMRKALRLVIDGTDPQLVRETLQADLQTREQDEHDQANVFRLMGGYSPTLGVIGTVMGLIHMLAQLSEPGKMGPAIAAAFIATFYGVSFANLALLPIADKLASQNAEAARYRRMVMDGVLGIQAGTNPTALEERLRSFLLAPRRAAKSGPAQQPQTGVAPEGAEAVGGT